MPILQVGNLPSNRLALTNKIYLNPSTLHSLFTNPESTPTFIVTIAGHPFLADSNPGVAPDEVGLNGLQRRFCQFSLSTRVEVVAFSPPPECILSALQVSVDLLSKKQTGAKAREIDTDRLMEDFRHTYMSQMVQVGQTLAMDFEGTKLELTIAQNDFLEGQQPYGHITGPTEISFRKAQGTKLVQLSGSRVAGGSGGGGTSIFLGDFDFEKLGIGGLDAEFNKIFRRAFASRIWPQHIIKQMGITHVRGMLLYGPPGCGKTLIARQIGKILNSREPKIVNGPEILNKFVGGSEEKIRELFAEAEKEQAEEGDHSMLHIIILDEMDAICKQRGTNRDSTGVSDSVVNQLLSKIDGVDSLNNILLIGMTNRKDMIDDALLRPGRLELHVEIGLPDKKGRTQILNIHTKNMQEARRITPEALNGMDEIANKTKNFSGAEIEGLIKAASSYALTRCVDVKDLSKPPDEKQLIVQLADLERALEDVEPKFGAKSTELKALYRNGFVPYGENFDYLMHTMERLVEQVRSSNKTPILSTLLRGPPSSGKTAVAAKIAVDSGFPFVRMISADEMIGYSESSKCSVIHQAFLDAYKSPLSLIFLDDIERIIDYVHIGPRFSNTVLQTLLVLLKKPPPDEGRRLLCIGTTSVPHVLEELGLSNVFSVSQSINLLEDANEITEVLQHAGQVSAEDARKIAKTIKNPIGIKQLLMVAEMARQASGTDTINPHVFLECLHTVGY